MKRVEKKEIKEEVVLEESKPNLYEGFGYPYNELRDRQFEVLIYNIFQKEIDAGNCKEKFDKAHLMQGVGEKGIDILLTYKGNNYGGVQCKKYKSRLTKPELVREIIKFILFYLKDKSLISDIEIFTYYIIVSYGFTENALKLLKNFNNNVVLEDKLQLWTEKVIKKFKSFQDFDYEKISGTLINVLKSIKVEYKIPEDIDILLNLYPTIIPNFFQVKTVFLTEDFYDLGQIIDDKYKEKLREYEPLKEENENLKKIINKISYEEISQVNEDYINMHLFLDKFNYLLDNRFTIIKRKKYFNSWKVGLLYFKNLGKISGYSFFPIPWNKNDLLIKKANKELWDELVRSGLGESWSDKEDNYMNDPKNFAQYVIFEKLKEIIENKQLDIHCNAFLAREYIFALIDRLYRQMGLQKKDAYSLEEIEFGFFKFLPIWIEETIKFLKEEKKNQFSRYLSRGYIKPIDIKDFINSQNLEIIDGKVNQRINEGLFETESYVIGDDEFSYKTFINQIILLKNTRNLTIKRPYKKRRFQSSYLHEDFTDEDIKYNLFKVFRKLPNVYNDLIKKNFPNLAKQFDLFNEISRIIVIYELKKDYHEYWQRFSVNIFYLRRENENLRIIDIYSHEDPEIQIFLMKPIEDKISFGGQEYIINRKRSCWERFDVIFSSTPLLKYSYDLIKRALEDYFSDTIEWNKQMIDTWLKKGKRIL